jgi:hypothetical protein
MYFVLLRECAPVETIAIIDAGELADAAEQCRNVARPSLHPLLPLPNEEMYREVLEQQHSRQAGTTISTFEVLHWPTASHTTRHEYTARKSEDIARPAVQLGEPQHRQTMLLLLLLLLLVDWKLLSLPLGGGGCRFVLSMWRRCFAHNTTRVYCAQIGRHRATGSSTRRTTHR